MKVIIQNLDDEATLGIGEALQHSGIETILWTPGRKSIFDMYFEQKPNLLIAHNTFIQSHFEELKKANDKFGGKVYAVGMEVDEGNFIGRCLLPFGNIINCINPKTNNPYFTCDVALIANYIRPNDYQYIEELTEKIESLNIGTFRIYGSKIESPYYVGPLTREQNRLVYKNTSIVIDLYGEHYLHPFLYDNFSICELVNPELDILDNTHDIDSTIAKIAEKVQLYEFSSARSTVAKNYNNFKTAQQILELTGFKENVDLVKQKEEAILNEYWNNSQ